MEIKAINIMGVKVSLGKCPDLMSVISLALDGRTGLPLFVTTPNPEIILAAMKDEEYFSTLNRAEIALPDGIGLWFAGLAMGYALNRKTGVDAVSFLLDICDKNQKKAAVINWRLALMQCEELESELKSEYPGATFKVIDMERGEEFDPAAMLNGYSPDLLLCTLGAPWQEKTLLRFQEAGVGRVLIGCGGSLDFILGKVRRAPRLLRAIGLEWLWRVIVQGDGQRLKRLKRIYNAVLVFPCKFIRWRFILPFFYRPNVACLIYKNTNDGPRILILERSDQPGHWQLLQGGLDGLPVAEGGLLEARQELNTNGFRLIKDFGFLYTYEFEKEGLERFRFTGGKHYGYRGQRQALAVIEFTGQDGDIKVNGYEHLGWKWVRPEELVAAVHERRKEATKIYLNKFISYINSQVSSINDQ